MCSVQTVVCRQSVFPGSSRVSDLILFAFFRGVFQGLFSCRYRCAAVAVDIADPVPNGGEQAAYQKLGFCKVLLPSQPTDTSNKQIYRCLTCRRCIRPSSQARLYSHR